MRFALAAAALLCGGCVTARPSLYSWGNYEDLIYVSYTESGKLAPEQQTQKLEQDYQIARSSGHRMPPGWHAHLGVLYYQIGRQDQALQELQTEKAEFPESAVFVDRLIANLGKSGASKS